MVYNHSENFLTRRTGFKTPEELIRNIYEVATPEITAGVVEHVHSMRSDGRKSAWTFGLATGMAHAALYLRDLPWIEVAPVRWMNFIRKELHWSWEKEFDSRTAANQLTDGKYSAMFKYKKDHNTGDAVCMAYWLSRNLHLMPETSNRLGHLRRLPTLHELHELRAKRLGEEIPVVE